MICLSLLSLFLFAAATVAEDQSTTLSMFDVLSLGYYGYSDLTPSASIVNAQANATTMTLDCGRSSDDCPFDSTMTLVSGPTRISYTGTDTLSSTYSADCSISRKTAAICTQTWPSGSSYTTLAGTGMWPQIPIVATAGLDKLSSATASASASMDPRRCYET